MNAHLKLLGVVLRKDLRLFWLFAPLTAGLNALANIQANRQQDEVLGALLVAATFLATGLLIFMVFHEDSAVSGKRDWLTRPVPGMTMLAAKSVFVVLFILLPGMLGAIANGFYLHRSPVEALVTGVAVGLGGTALTSVLCMMALAALTSGFRQAIGAFLLCLLMLWLGYILVRLVPGFPDATSTASGSDWIRTRTLEWLVAFTALAVLWILYRRRHGRRAALALVGVAVLAGGTWYATMNSSRMFALQKWLSPDPAAASTVAVSLLPGCFPARTLGAQGETATSVAEKIPTAIFPYTQREQAGADAVAFVVRLVVDRLPQDGMLVLSRTQLTYRMADGAAVSLDAGRTRSPWVRTESGQRAIDQYWLLSKKDYERLAADPGTTAHIDYSLSLLKPEATAVFAADRKRAFRTGIGFCGARRAMVDCYRTGDQPALLVARLEGQSDTADSISADPDFTPAVLDFWGGRHHQMIVALPADSQVRVTAYEAQVHFNRQFDVPGVLGGPVSSCPLP